MKYVVIAGESSGELHGAGLIESVRRCDPDAEFRFFGGDMMEKAAGCPPELHYSELNVMGFSAVISKMPSILRHLRQAVHLLQEWRPDALLLVDFPGFNLKLAKSAHKLGIPVHYFISPKVWAWKEYRVRSIKKYVDRMYSILPFEEEWFRKRGYEVIYVGNPSVQEIDRALSHIPPLKHFCGRQGIIDMERKIIAILPGSRKGEIRNNLPLMIEAARQFPDFQYIVAAAPSVPEKFYRSVAQDPDLKLVFDSTITLLKYSRAALVTSGTATLETALVGTPQVVCYRANGNKLSYKVMERLLKVKYVSLPNLVAGAEIVPELLVHKCTVPSIRRALLPLLSNSPGREWQVKGYRLIRARLGSSVATDYAGELIVGSLVKD